MLLGKRAIIDRREAGEIVIEPFNRANLGTAQYDVTLGAHFFRETSRAREIYNPFDERHVRKKWEAGATITNRELADDRRGELLVGVRPDERLILIQPGEMILAPRAAASCRGSRTLAARDAARCRRAS